jgi:peptide/nickel transport system substrate-binding protein
MAALATLAVCVGQAARADMAPCAATGGIFHAAMSTNTPTMDAVLSTTTVSRQLAIHIWESLVTVDDNYRVIPELAENWQRADDGLSYTFRLRPGVKFHDGRTLTAEDVQASLQRYFKVSPAAARFKSVASVDVVDPQTVKLTLSKDFALLANLSFPFPVASIMPADIVRKYGDKEIRGADLIGTGPFRFIAWTPDVSVRMGRFADYAPDARFDGPTGFGGRRTACVDEVDFIPATEEASRVAGLQTGAYDYAEAVPITSVDTLSKDPAAKVIVVKPKWGVVLELNATDPVMKNQSFRRALVAALNMTQVMQAVSFGNRPDYFRTQPSIFFPEQTTWYSDAGGDVYNHQDLEQVKKLLAEANYHGEEVVYLTNQNYSWMYKASQAVAAMWRRAGINVKLELMDWPSQIQRAQSLKGWAINQTGWSPRFDPTQTSDNFHCGAPGGYGHCDPQMDALLDGLNTGAPDEERKKLWDQLQGMVWDTVAVVRLGDFFEPEAVRADVAGYKPFYVTPRFWNVAKTK